VPPLSIGRFAPDGSAFGPVASDIPRMFPQPPRLFQVSDNTITKTKGCNGCGDAGATSQQGITSGDGSVQFKVSANSHATVGLSNGNKNTQSNEIKFGLRFTPGIVEVRESGALKAEWPYLAGSVYKIAVEDGEVNYYENGTLKYTSKKKPSYPLIVDTTLGTVGAGVQDAIITK